MNFDLDVWSVVFKIFTISLSCILYNFQDKVAAVRALAVLCFGFFPKDESFRKSMWLFDTFALRINI